MVGMGKNGGGVGYGWGQNDLPCHSVLLISHRLRWYGHVLRKDENDCVKKAWIMKWKV